MKIYPITELDKSDGEKYLIGVASSPEKAEVMILEFYGSYEEVLHQSYEDMTTVWTKHLVVNDHEGKPYSVQVWVSCYNLDSI